VCRDAQAMLRSARTREAQNWWLAQAAVLGVVAGLILFPLIGFPIARNLPFGSLADRLATAALGQDAWSAGAGLMSRANPAQWKAINESLLRSEAVEPAETEEVVILVSTADVGVLGISFNTEYETATRRELVILADLTTADEAITTAVLVGRIHGRRGVLGFAPMRRPGVVATTTVSAPRPAPVARA
jgi:hypothetical protein